MIFNTVSDYDNGVVQESPYECGLYGAMMHVYENECNYNAMMKAVGLSELKYYQETGGDLFVQEAGALSGFITKAKQFFKKVIEKIKSIFHKFAATINQFAMKDKDFVKKYEKEIQRKDLTDFEYEGYKFPGVSKVSSIIKPDLKNNGISDPGENGDYGIETDPAKAGVETKEAKWSDSDLKQDEKDTNRAQILGKNGKLDSDEFRDELKEALYGDKETFEPQMSMQLNYIRESDKTIREIEKLQKEIVKAIDKYIKALERAESTVGNGYSSKESEAQNKLRQNLTARLNYSIDIWKDASNSYTIAFGMATQAAKDRTKQAKAICVKAISYKSKNESASVYQSEGAYDDIFGDVKIV